MYVSIVNGNGTCCVFGVTFSGVVLCERCKVCVGGYSLVCAWWGFEHRELVLCWNVVIHCEIGSLLVAFMILVH